jgi:hypothetical protein
MERPRLARALLAGALLALGAGLGAGLVGVGRVESRAPREASQRGMAWRAPPALSPESVAGERSPGAGQTTTAMKAAHGPDDHGASSGEGAAPGLDGDASAGLAPAELARLRAESPANLFWELTAPTTDQALLARRAEEARRMNALRGKVLSGTGTEEELDAYFAQRQRFAADHRELALLVLRRLGPELSGRERALYELAARMHEQRLADLPRRRAEAVARMEAQAQARTAWRRAGRPGAPRRSPRPRRRSAAQGAIAGWRRGRAPRRPG